MLPLSRLRFVFFLAVDSVYPFGAIKTASAARLRPACGVWRCTKPEIA